MRIHVFTFLFLFVAATVRGQDKDRLFGNEAPKAKHGFILAANGNFDIPAADMAKRFGASYRLGPGVMYKTSSNWFLGAKFDFLLGSKIKQDSLMINITDRYSAKSGGLYEFVSVNNQRIGIPVYERGYAIGLSAGKLLPLNKLRPDIGILLLTTAGFMQHRLNIFDKDKAVPQIRGNLVKGYDRLTNGAFIEQFAGYTYFSKYQLINFSIGLDCLVGFTQGRRDYLYDVMRPDNAKRLDILYGIRANWYIPIFRKKSEDMLFE